MLLRVLEIWLKLKFWYLCMYYETLICWFLLALFSLTLLLFRQCFFLLLLFFCFFLNFVKPKLFCQYFFESLRKQQLRGILLNMYLFNFINFTNLCKLLCLYGIALLVHIYTLLRLKKEHMYFLYILYFRFSILFYRRYYFLL